MAWSEQSCPDGRWPAKTIEPAAVIIPTVGDITGAFFATRHAAVADHLSNAGIPAVAMAAASNRAESLEQLIATYRPQLIINRAFTFGYDVIAQSAERHANIKYLTVNHSSQSDLMRSRSWWHNQAQHIKLALAAANIWYGSVDDRNPCGRLHGPKCIYLPNVITAPPVTPRDPERQTVSIICRSDPNKNVSTQLQAIAMSRSKPRLLTMVKHENHAAMAAQCDLLGLDWISRPWGGWSDYLEVVAAEVSVGLQCSFSESFNYVAIEHMLLGRPVVGSPAIRYLPQQWQADPEDPEDIARRLDAAFEHYKLQSTTALQRAAEIMKSQNEEFIATIRGLIHGHN